jgi:hypothetical protein
MAIITGPQLAFIPLILLPIETLIVIWFINRAMPMFGVVQRSWMRSTA